MTTANKTALDALRTFTSAAVDLDRAWTREVEGFMVDGYPFPGHSFDELVHGIMEWRDKVADAMSEEQGDGGAPSAPTRADLIARTVKLYEEGVPHADAEAALRLIGQITAPDADLTALAAELAEQEGTGPDLNVCADCGGSTAPGTPDPHVCVAPCESCGQPSTDLNPVCPSCREKLARDKLADDVVAALTARGVKAYWEYPGFFHLPVPGREDMHLHFGEDGEGWYGHVEDEDGKEVDWEAPTLPQDATATAIADALAAAAATLATVMARKPVSIVIDHGRFRACYDDSDGSGEGMVNIYERMTEGEPMRHIGLATYGEHVGGWNDVGDVEEVPEDDLEAIGELLSDAITAQEEGTAPTTTRQDAAAWVEALANTFTDENGKATPVAARVRAGALAETLGSFLSSLAEDYESTTDAADFGKRVAQTLSGLLGCLKTDIGFENPGMAPWVFATEIAP